MEQKNRFFEGFAKVCTCNKTCFKGVQSFLFGSVHRNYRNCLSRKHIDLKFVWSSHDACVLGKKTKSKQSLIWICAVHRTKQKIATLYTTLWFGYYELFSVFALWTLSNGAKEENGAKRDKKSLHQMFKYLLPIKDQLPSLYWLDKVWNLIMPEICPKFPINQALHRFLHVNK